MIEMNQWDRNRIWEMIFRGLAERNEFHIEKDEAKKNPIIDPDVIVRGFKNSIQKSGG
jgi:hypothetical protein